MKPKKLTDRHQKADRRTDRRTDRHTDIRNPTYKGRMDIKLKIRMYRLRHLVEYL